MSEQKSVKSLIFDTVGGPEKSFLRFWKAENDQIEIRVETNVWTLSVECKKIVEIWT